MDSYPLPAFRCVLFFRACILIDHIIVCQLSAASLTLVSVGRCVQLQAQIHDLRAPQPLPTFVAPFQERLFRICRSRPFKVVSDVLTALNAVFTVTVFWKQPDYWSQSVGMRPSSITYAVCTA